MIDMNFTIVRTNRVAHPDDVPIHLRVRRDDDLLAPRSYVSPKGMAITEVQAHRLCPAKPGNRRPEHGIWRLAVKPSAKKCS
jgi:hypothetical protein